MVADGTVKQLREDAHLTLSDVGRACGTTAATVWWWEHGRQPHPQLGIRYAELLGMLGDLYEAPSAKSGGR